REPDQTACPGPLEAQDGRGLIAAGTIDPDIMISTTPIIVCGPGPGRQQQEDFCLPCCSCRADDKEVMLNETSPIGPKASRDHAIEARTDVFGQSPTVLYWPAAPCLVGILRGRSEL